MNKLKSFFMGLLLLVIVFIAVFLSALIYRANERSSVKSYIFQMNNSARNRVGTLQDIHNISAEELLTKLIHKYVSEYFKVIPGEKDVTDRQLLRKMSTTDAIKIWEETTAKEITKQSEQKMFRLVEFPAVSIEPLNKPAGYDYNTAVVPKPIYYSVHYETITWAETNTMNTKPVHNYGVLNIEAMFEPGIKQDEGEGANKKTFDVKKYLESGKDPSGLFMFKVTNIGNKGI